ncbi:MAG: hypothetical protein VKJ06_01930 [Vampirovibrionales bacterium]|nr:hypothetical protein [Vampirovibrionales bacterium]
MHYNSPAARNTQAATAQRRQHAGHLLEAVLDETLTARQALNRWPLFAPGKPEPDPSLAAAYQALWHFESDEEKQQGQVFYMDIQFEMLSAMSRFLKLGQPLPPDILTHYEPAIAPDEQPVVYDPQLGFFKWLPAWFAQRKRIYVRTLRARVEGIQALFLQALGRK